MIPETLLMPADRAADVTGTGLVLFGSVSATINQTLTAWVPLVIGGLVLAFRGAVEVQKYYYAIHKARRDEAIAEARFDAEISAMREEMREQSDRRQIVVEAIQTDLNVATTDRSEMMDRIKQLQARVEQKRDCPLAVNGVPACEQAHETAQPGGGDPK